MTITDRPQDESLRPGQVGVEEAPAKPVKYWALLGVLSLAFMAYLGLRWGLSSNFKRTPAGPTPLPTAMKVSLVTFTVFGWVVSLWMLWRYLVKPWRREGHITLDGLLIISFTLLVWQDPLSDWMGPGFTYNTWLPNWGSWLSVLPGKVFPQGGKLAEPPIITCPLYIWAGFGFVLVCNWVMRRVKAKRPQTGKFGLVMTCFATIVILDFIWEMTMMRGGYWAYTSTINSLTVFPSKYYRFPLYESVTLGMTWTAFSCIRYFKNDRGQLAAERGIDLVRGSTKAKAWLRFLAIYGMLSLVFLVLYQMPYAYFVANSDGPPKDIASRSYFIEGICGAGTTYACWGKGVPIPRPGSGHLDPAGNYIPGSDPPPAEVNVNK